MSLSRSVCTPTAGWRGLRKLTSAREGWPAMTGRLYRRRSVQAGGAQELGDRPGLERSAGGRVGRVAVGGLTDRADAPFAQVREQAVEHAVHRHSDGPRGVDVRSDQPRPDRALVVGVVAGPHVAAMPASVA